MKTRLIVAISTLALSVSAYAYPTKPGSCPETDAIAAGGLSQDIVIQDNNGQWVVGLLSNDYNTDNNWSFVVGKIDADSSEEAYEKAVEGLNSLHFRQGPVKIKQLTRWGCAYTTDENYIAVAVTPALQGVSPNVLQSAV